MTLQILCAGHYCWFILILLVVCVAVLKYPAIIYFIYKADSKSLPYISHIHFVGREKETTKILEYLDYGLPESKRIVNIYGSPGFGKSTLAIHIGHLMLEKGVYVHYVDLAGAPNEGIKLFLAQRIWNSYDPPDPSETVSFDNFLQWVRGRNFYDLIILDDSDEVLRSQKEEFQYVIDMVVKNSPRFKFLITSREKTSLLSSFEVFKLHELSVAAACELLEHNIPSIMKANVSEKEELAKLTGSVPLALQIVGALLRLNLPSLTTPAAVISELRAEPILTLSPKQLPENYTISASFSLSYRYLSAEQKRVGQLLSNFPGSFNFEACIAVFVTGASAIFKGDADNFAKAVTSLLERSLLEHDHAWSIPFS